MIAPLRRRLAVMTAISAFVVQASLVSASTPVDVGSSRELFVDHRLIERLGGATLKMHRPVDRGHALEFDKPWEGPFCAYVTIIHNKEAGKYQAYYRGSRRDEAGATIVKNMGNHQVVSYAESADGITWTKPELDLFPTGDGKPTNIVLAEVSPDTHNFSPFIDTRPGVPAEERYKGIGGYHREGLSAYASPDGIRWTRIGDKPVLTARDVGFAGDRPTNDNLVFDSQNVPFWSEAEGKYVLFYRVYKDKKRRIARVESDDFKTWSKPTLMEYTSSDGQSVPIEQLYTNQTSPYYRSSNLYIATAARFMLGRQVLTTQQADAIGVNPKYFNDCSDAVFMTARPGGSTYDRTFMEAFVAPGIGAENWTSRTNYPAVGIVPTGRDEMSVYVNQNYGQPTAHLRRYSLRLDGFASISAGYGGGEMVTKPLTFAGEKLMLNFSTSAAGGVKVELQNADGTAVPGFGLDDCMELIGNEIEREVTWKGGSLASLAGKPVRLRFVLRDADIFALRFAESEASSSN